MFDLLQRYGKRELALILLLVGAVLLAPITTYAVWPQLRDYRAASDSQQTLAAAMANEDELIARLDTLRDEVATLEKRLHGDTANLPPKQVGAYIIGRLQAISWRNRVQLVGVQPMEGNEIDAFQELLFDVRINGDYFDLHNWLRDLSDELGFVVIKHYRMSPADNKRPAPTLAAELTIASYRTAMQ